MKINRNIFTKRKNVSTALCGIFAVAFLFSCVSLPEKSTTAQTNQSAKLTADDNQNESDATRKITDPCRYKSADFLKRPEDNQLYELINAGFPKEVSLDEATAFFNRYAQCDETASAYRQNCLRLRTVEPD